MPRQIWENRFSQRQRRMSSIRIHGNSNSVAGLNKTIKSSATVEPQRENNDEFSTKYVNIEKMQ
jgi:hypothetical protein